MVQLYFLSVLCNSLCGYFLFTGGEGDESDKVGFLFNHPTFQLVLGIMSIVTGVLKLLSPMSKIPILGDLVPAAAGIAAGFILIFGIYNKGRSSAPISESLDSIGSNLLRFRKPLGLCLLGSALLHFLLPGALFL